MSWLLCSCWPPPHRPTRSHESRPDYISLRLNPVCCYRSLTTTQDAERRRVARKASREARKQKQQQAQASSTATLQPMQQQQPLNSSSSSTAELHADLQNLDDLRHQLSQLWVEEPFSSSPLLPQEHRQHQQPQHSATSPSTITLAPQTPSSASRSTPHVPAKNLGPTALSLPSSSALVTSSTARTRHQRRADRFSPRSAGASAAGPTSAKSQAARTMTAPDSTAQFMKVWVHAGEMWLCVLRGTCWVGRVDGMEVMACLRHASLCDLLPSQGDALLAHTSQSCMPYSEQ